MNWEIKIAPAEFQSRGKLGEKFKRYKIATSQRRAISRGVFDRGSRGRGSIVDDTGAKFCNILLSIVKSFIGAQRLLLRRDAIESTSYN